MAKTDVILSAMSDSNEPIDWWFIYKIAGKSTVSNKTKAKGTEYVYFDSEKQDGEKLHLSEFLMSDPKNGAVANTLNQIYNNLDNPNMGWFFYNDEDPLTGKTNGTRGHTKGVLCFNLATNTAFWLIHSAPKFSPKGSYSYPATAMGNAQTFLCISLKDADTAKAIAAQMFQAQQPNVYLASGVPTALKNQPDDPRVSLINNKVTTDRTGYGNFISFTSRAGMPFRCIAKNKEWSTPAGSDFYNDLVGPTLNESLELETWEHDPTPGSADSDNTHNVMAMKEVDLSPLGIDPSYSWSEESDHAKLAISERGQGINYICVGDLNFTIPQEKRSGGTVAFQNDDLWNSLIEILTMTNNKTVATARTPSKIVGVKNKPAKGAAKPVAKATTATKAKKSAAKPATKAAPTKKAAARPAAKKAPATTTKKSAAKPAPKTSTATKAKKSVAKPAPKAAAKKKTAATPAVKKAAATKKK